MSEEIDVLKFVCRRLEEVGIPYMLTGSVAANFYAVPRMTRDIDIVIELLELEADRFFQTFQSDFYISLSSIKEAINYQSIFNIIHNDTVFKIDFIIRKSSSYRQVEFKRRKRVQFDDVLIWIVSPEDLILSKLFWAKDSLSELQIRDVKNLLGSLKNLDEGYIQQWVKELNLQHVFEKVTAYA